MQALHVHYEQPPLPALGRQSARPQFTADSPDQRGGRTEFVTGVLGLDRGLGGQFGRRSDAPGIGGQAETASMPKASVPLLAGSIGIMGKECAL